VLTTCHAEVEVIEDQGCHADVAPRRAHQMGAADPATPVADEVDDVEVGAGQFDAGGVGQAAAVEPVEAAGIQILVGEPHATDVAHDDDGGGIPLQANEGTIERFKDQAVATAGTEPERHRIAIGCDG